VVTWLGFARSRLRLWGALPVLGACLIAVLATTANGPVVGLIAGGVTGLIAAFATEHPVHLLARVAPMRLARM